jgi:hypothetical protein
MKIIPTYGCFIVDPNWIIILFFIYLDTSKVEKIGGIILQVILIVGSNLEN